MPSAMRSPQSSFHCPRWEIFTHQGQDSVPGGWDDRVIISLSIRQWRRDGHGFRRIRRRGIGLVENVDPSQVRSRDHRRSLHAGYQIPSHKATIALGPLGETVRKSVRKRLEAMSSSLGKSVLQALIQEKDRPHHRSSRRFVHTHPRTRSRQARLGKKRGRSLGNSTSRSPGTRVSSFTMSL